MKEHHHYLFIIMQFGRELYRREYTDYTKAQTYYFRVYPLDDRACRVFVDGKELKFFEATVYFDLKKHINTLYYLESLGENYYD